MTNDVWDDESDSQTDQLELDRERKTRAERLYNTAYRETIDAGREKSVQLGFDIGFHEGGISGLQYGILRGASKTLLLCMKDKLTADEIKKIEASIDLSSKSVMLSVCESLAAQPFPEVSGIPLAKNPREAIDASIQIRQKAINNSKDSDPESYSTKLSHRHPSPEPSFEGKERKVGLNVDLLQSVQESQEALVGLKFDPKSTQMLVEAGMVVRKVLGDDKSDEGDTNVSNAEMEIKRLDSN
uniref:Essential protein Yae1 N-terminal domain-containing protein n=1 Tax=Polytomella parva TaxID=51329 RepID=A0A7S0UYE1_9CHLO|mmetsp:Transcript_22511/g.39927  ORF Transcript_22511/g.39927 Transcript_22511/m.39927 type:complete len:242 (+) Transcript_22511:84-809(+)|eukprot:CAMPEP_0175039440 /NCGR_PEP_ID=MMETSP0052_2-20121109/583_1 /TAXON_ID=51329 ORGANISM="Polytomella parva, Strain SAG 63-3" /NCGR_SAMPLE_ID=MMETSP0052_2 /ASSEMBLY_ACC=CAM_ASM_000194 /LENGTH=241 /DNA_ID=CAMNT_0016301289 /DNA_START=9 /DNA_END=734 /DNA_ORIENTATION=+